MSFNFFCNEFQGVIKYFSSIINYTLCSEFRYKHKLLWFTYCFVIAPFTVTLFVGYDKFVEISENCFKENSCSKLFPDKHMTAIA